MHKLRADNDSSSEEELSEEETSDVDEIKLPNFVPSGRLQDFPRKDLFDYVRQFNHEQHSFPLHGDRTTLANIHKAW